VQLGCQTFCVNKWVNRMKSHAPCEARLPCRAKNKQLWRNFLKQKRDIYEMHKYWGKKPSKDLNELIEHYSNTNDTLLDPFAGYGVFCIEAYILNRKVILNDLNPMASFIQESVLERNINIEKLKKEFEVIKNEVESYINSWFTLEVEGVKKVMTSVLRSKNNEC